MSRSRPVRTSTSSSHGAQAASGRASSSQGLRITYAPDPRRYYPRTALRRRIQGTARVGLVVDVDGRVLRAWIVQTSGSDLLDRAALALIHAYRFEPPGSPRRTRMPVTFQLARSARTSVALRRTR